MSVGPAVVDRLATGATELARIVVGELLLGGDPIVALLTIGGLCIWAVTFGVGGYVAVRAGARTLRRRLGPADRAGHS